MSPGTASTGAARNLETLGLQLSAQTAPRMRARVGSGRAWGGWGPARGDLRPGACVLGAMRAQGSRETRRMCTPRAVTRTY